MNCLSYNENSVRPRAAESFSTGNSESKQIPNNGEKDPNKMRLTAAAAVNKKKVIMIEVVDTGASVSILGQSQWELIKAPFTLYHFHTKTVRKFYPMKTEQCKHSSIFICNSLHLIPDRKTVQCRR